MAGETVAQLMKTFPFARVNKPPVKIFFIAWSSLTTVMRSNYIRTARSKGLSAVDVVLRHGLRNAIQSPLQMMALQLGMLFANILIVERIFGWPGLGLYMVQAFAASDLPVIMGVAVAFALIYTAANIVVDLLQALADPRLRRVS
jgi:peptide/nickel transport system permease protein/dipeptide transport system permease protein